jgi:hypothetical protein
LGLVGDFGASGAGGCVFSLLEKYLQCSMLKVLSVAFLVGSSRIKQGSAMFGRPG